MVIYPKAGAVTSTGAWDRNTLRYVPRSGGSQSRLPINSDEEIPRYYGFVGVDEKLTEHIDSMAKLYNHIGGKPVIPPGPAGKFVTLLLQQADEAYLRTAGAKDEGEGESREVQEL